VDEEPEPLHLQAQDDSGINFLTMSAVLTFHAAHCLALPQTLAIVCSSPKDWRAASCVASTPGTSSRTPIFLSSQRTLLTEWQRVRPSSTGTSEPH
jgi:hypothetical protein